MTLTTTDAACETLKPIKYSYDGDPDTLANVIDTPETIAQIVRYNAQLEALCKEE